jgi:hypothetical protein
VDQHHQLVKEVGRWSKGSEEATRSRITDDIKEDQKQR